jgi:membrane-associated phospholipid phosphatase
MTELPYQRVKLKLVIILYASALVMSVVYWAIGTTFFNSPLSYYQYLIFTSVVGFMIVGGYQLYLWTEYNNYRFKVRCFAIKLDEKIPFIPSFIWIYSLSYYAIIGLVVITIPSIETGVEYIFGGLILLTIQCIIHYFIPSCVPSHWRKYKVKSKSTKFLNFVQAIDSGRNCMPSMHMSVAMYVSLLLFPVLSYYSFLFVLIIAVSCLVVKQHGIMDLIPGIILGWLVHYIVILKGGIV